MSDDFEPGAGWRETDSIDQPHPRPPISTPRRATRRAPSSSENTPATAAAA